MNATTTPATPAHRKGSKPGAPAAPAPAAPAPAAPAVETPTPAAPPATAAEATVANGKTDKGKGKKAEHESRAKAFYDTAEAALAEAATRTKGARRPFKYTLNGKDFFVVAVHAEQGWKWVAEKLGGSCASLDKKQRAPAGAPTLEGILAGLPNMSESDRAAVMKALDAFKSNPALTPPAAPSK